MRLLLPLCVLLLVCGLLLPAAPAAAGDDTSAKVIWTFEKGAVVQALDVTDMDPALRAALLVQMKDQGWTRAGAKTAVKAAAKAPPMPKPAPNAKGDMERDIEELIRRGGKLPKGWRPHGLRPKPTAPQVVEGSAKQGRSLTHVVGTLMLRYIETQADPVRGPVYEAMLRDIARTMSTSGLAGLHAMLPRLKQQAEAGAREPKLGPAYREILQILRGVHDPVAAWRAALKVPTPPVGPSRVAPVPPLRPSPPRVPVPSVAPAPPFKGPFEGAPGKLGGAPLSYVVHTGNPASILLTVGVVPKGSTAAAAGLLDWDRIIQIDGKPVSEASMKRAARVFREGGKLKLLVVRRDDKRETLDLEFEKE